jgi:murein DD-endopeptidase MepM/ murein hydrolase activator NlpD
MLGMWWLGASMLSSREAAGEPAAITLSPRAAAPVPRARARAEATSGAASAGVGRSDAVPARAEMPVSPPTAEIAELLDKRLLVPVSGVPVTSLRSTFSDARSGGRRHEAMDILAPRGTPVVAAVEGRIVKLFTSALGGLTIYQFDVEERFCYYYAHLDSYAPELTEGHTVRPGQTIGFVGTTGNAPPGTPHLHFAVFRLGAEKRWWDGTPIDPYLVFR